MEIYVAALSAYNSGIHHGKWIDAEQSIDEIENEIETILRTSPCANEEEWAIHDTDSFCGIEVGEYESIMSVCDKASFISEFPQFVELLHSYTTENARTHIEQKYLGTFKSLYDYAYEITEGDVELPDYLAHYIDYERMGQDMEMGGEIYTLDADNNELHIFSNC